MADNNKTSEELAAEQKAAAEEAKARAEDIKKAEDIYLKDAPKAEAQLKKKLKTLRMLNEESRKEASLLEKKMAEMTAEQKILETTIAYHEKQIQQAEQVIELAGADSEVRLKAAKDVKKHEDALAKLEKKNDDLTISIRRRSKADKEAMEASAGAQGAIANFSNSITGWNKNIGASVGNINAMKGAMHGLVKSVGSILTPSGIINIFAAFASVVGQAIIDIDKAEHAFQRAAGSGDKLREVFYGLRAETMATHLEGAELTQGLIDMRAGITAFDGLTTTAAKSTAVLAAQLDKLGFAYGDQAKIMQFMNLTMRETVGEAQRTVQEIYAMSEASGKGPAQLAADFQAAAPVLAVYGTKMSSEFRKMSALSRETGIEMNKLLGVVGAMDTFEGAASAAGTLNAFLGGPYLNTVELNTLKEGDRLIAIKRAMVASGKHFDQMSRFQQKGVAKALNMDVAEAAAFFNSSEAAIKQRSIAMEEASKREEDYKKKIQETQPFMESLTLAFRDLGISMMKSLFGIDENASPAEMTRKIHMKMKEFKEWLHNEAVPTLKRFASTAKTIFYVVLGVKAVGVLASLGTAFMTWASISTASMTAVATKAGVTTVALNRMRMAGKGIGAIGGAMGLMQVGSAMMDKKASGAKTATRMGGGLMSAVGGAMMFIPGMQLGGLALMAAGQGLNYAGSRMDDGIVQNVGGRSKVTPINSGDTAILYKKGGAMQESMGQMIKELKTLNKKQKDQEKLLSQMAQNTSNTELKIDGKVLAHTVRQHDSKRSTGKLFR